MSPAGSGGPGRPPEDRGPEALPSLGSRAVRGLARAGERGEPVLGGRPAPSSRAVGVGCGEGDTERGAERTNDVPSAVPSLRVYSIAPNPASDPAEGESEFYPDPAARSTWVGKHFGLLSRSWGSRGRQDRRGAPGRPPEIPTFCPLLISDSSGLPADGGRFREARDPPTSTVFIQHRPDESLGPI